MIELTTREYEEQRKNSKTNEGYVYTYPNDKTKIVKVIEPRLRTPEYLEIKQYTIKLLLENIDYLKHLNIAIPLDGIMINDNIKTIQNPSNLRGYLANNIKGVSLNYALSPHYDVSLDMKIDYLKQVGTLLREMKAIREQYPHLSNLYYNDIHEENFIVGQNNIVTGIDFDSCSIQDNIPIQSYYTSMLNMYAKNVKKYIRCKQVCNLTTDIVPDENLEVYCYIRMIINFMYGRRLYNLNSRMLDNYLNYLDSNGGNLELLYAISRIFDDKEDNINIDYLLDYIKDIFVYSNCRYNSDLSDIIYSNSRNISKRR